MAFNIHETVMSLVGGRLVPMTFIVVGVIFLTGGAIDEKQTFEIVSKAEKRLEIIYAVQLMTQEAFEWLIILVAMAFAFRALNLKALHDLEETGQPKGKENENSPPKTD